MYPSSVEDLRDALELVERIHDNPASSAGLAASMGWSRSTLFRRIALLRDLGVELRAPGVWAAGEVSGSWRLANADQVLVRVREWLRLLSSDLRGRPVLPQTQHSREFQQSIQF